MRSVSSLPRSLRSLGTLIPALRVCASPLPCLSRRVCIGHAVSGLLLNWSSSKLKLNILAARINVSFYSSVERVVEYLDLPGEPPAIIEANRPPAYWPSSSGPNSDSLISVEDLVIKYSPELTAVLHGISFDLKAKERVGLLGRTGSGKSTLAMSILRFVSEVWVVSTIASLFLVCHYLQYPLFICSKWFIV